MAKSAKGKSATDYTRVGKTSDGIEILKPKTAPTGFTLANIKASIAQVLGFELPKSSSKPSVSRKAATKTVKKTTTRRKGPASSTSKATRSGSRTKGRKS